MNETPPAKPSAIRRHAVLAALVVIAIILGVDLLLRRREPAPRGSPLAAVKRTPAASPGPIILTPRSAAVEPLPATRPAYLHLEFPALEIDDLSYRDALTVLLEIADKPVPLIIDPDIDQTLNRPTFLRSSERRTDRVTLHLHRVTFHVALEAIVAAASQAIGQELSYRADAHAIRIAHAANLRDVRKLQTDVRVYDVRDLLRSGVAFSKSIGSIDPAEPETGGLFGGGRRKTPEEILSEHLLKGIHAIDPPSWKWCSDPIYFAGRIVIEQTPDNHERISRLLAALRLDPAPLVPKDP